MSERERCRLRLRLPNGAEFEAEGESGFVQAERHAFLSQTPLTQAAIAGAPGYQEPAWAELVEAKNGGLQLRAKTPGKTQKDACLVLLAASQRLLNTPKPTAAQLARWLRASGYPITRVDRAIAEAVTGGEILASGTRRARRYELTGPGRAKAFLLADELAAVIHGPKSARS